MTFNLYLLVGLGGGLGAISRVLLTQILPQNYYGVPLQIMIVNIFGCFLMGFITEYIKEYLHDPQSFKYFFIPGFLGGFTTFSSFALDFGQLFEKNNFEQATIYLFASVFLSLIFFFIGLESLKYIKY